MSLALGKHLKAELLRVMRAAVQELVSNNYVESKCEAVLREMRKCCARYPEGRSICCSGFEREEREKRQAAASEGIPPPPQ
ncbi:hypothetical protein ASZ78_000834 [Callipepla squamata]|uniref:Cx9C motif-containing protein 4 n=1 Tax=Callipepla squamata TaxID=9009 RepID=A0A226MEY0_CALSU|nr:hypothetical protein ASZ78_000834 [Callipepla squamata]